MKSIRIRAIRNLTGYCLPSFCTRGERRDVESILVKALYGLDQDYKGVYYSIKGLNLILFLIELLVLSNYIQLIELSPEEEATLANVT